MSLAKVMIILHSPNKLLDMVLVDDLEFSILEVDEFWLFVRKRSATSSRRIRRGGAVALETA